MGRTKSLWNWSNYVEKSRKRYSRLGDYKVMGKDTKFEGGLVSPLNAFGITRTLQDWLCQLGMGKPRKLGILPP